MSVADKYQDQGFDCRPQAVASWLNALPRASVGKTGEMIYHVLKDINAQTLKAKDRLRTLEALRETVHYVTSNMRRHFCGMGAPLPEKSMLISLACQSIYDDMAKGYNMIFEQVMDNQSLFTDKKTLALAAHRAISYIEQSLLLTYEIHAANMHHYWQELNGLYQSALLCHIQQMDVQDELLLTSRKSSIESEFKRIILLYLAEPYNLRSGEVEEIHDFLETAQELVDLKKPCELTAQERSQRIMMVDLTEDFPPQRWNADEQAADSVITIHTQRLVKSLQVQLDALINGNKPHDDPRHNSISNINLLRRLTESWAQTRRRRFARQQVFSKVNITVGLHSTHMQLTKEYNHTQGAEIDFVEKHGNYKAQFEAIELENKNATQEDVWSMVYAWANENKERELYDEIVIDDPVTAASAAADKDLPDAVQNNWTLLNESAEGFCLMCVDSRGHNLQVGELVSIQRGNNAVRAIGIVRWLKAYGENSIEIGGLLIAPNAQAVSLIRDDHNKKDKVVDRGLLLPAVAALQYPESLLTFSRQYRVGDKLQLQSKDGLIQEIQITKYFADNNIVSQFLFVRLQAQSSDHETTVKQSARKHAGFDDIWQDI